MSSSSCSAVGENCWLTRCCSNTSLRCFMKNEAWAGCKESCSRGIHADDPLSARTKWTCMLVPLSETQARQRQIAPSPHGEGVQVAEPSSNMQYLQRRPHAPQVASGPAPWSSATGTEEHGELFCFALIQPSGYEPKMLEDQYGLRTSIFACDKYAVYSNTVMAIAPGVNTRMVESDLKCEFHEIAWNAWIFIAVWKRVIEDSFYKSYSWTVKADADAVFFPDRLRAIVREHSTAGYLNNCKYGLHGPIEVLSRKAVEALAADYRTGDGKKPASCVRSLPKLGTWGEDMFLERCLHKVLGVQPVLDERLMCESHCDCPNWYWCHNGSSRVVYHPFKRVDMYRQCMANAQYML